MTHRGPYRSIVRNLYGVGVGAGVLSPGIVTFTSGTVIVFCSVVTFGTVTSVFFESTETFAVSTSYFGIWPGLISTFGALASCVCLTSQAARENAAARTVTVAAHWNFVDFIMFRCDSEHLHEMTVYAALKSRNRPRRVGA